MREQWEGNDETIESCTVIMTDANVLVTEMHDRMPVILPRESYDEWLDPKQKDPKPLQALVKPCAAWLMQVTQ